MSREIRLLIMAILALDGTANLAMCQRTASGPSDGFYWFTDQGPSLERETPVCRRCGYCQPECQCRPAPASPQCPVPGYPVTPGYGPYAVPPTRESQAYPLSPYAAPGMPTYGALAPGLPRQTPSDSAPFDASRSSAQPSMPAPQAQPPSAGQLPTPSATTPSSPSAAAAQPSTASSGTAGASDANLFAGSSTPAGGSQSAMGNLSASMGATLGSQGASNMIGDNFGGSGSSLSVVVTTEWFDVTANGLIVSGGPGDPNAVIVFETTNGTPNDFFSVGTGMDTNGDGNADSFAISEPIPPSDAPTSPGPTFTFDGGTATNSTGTFANGDLWNVGYSFSELTLVNIPVGGAGGGGGAGGLVGRLKIAENVSPIPQDRFFLNYSRFHNVPLSQRGVEVNRFTPGLEKTFLNGRASYEFRIPIASTLSSNVVSGGIDDITGELGNLTTAIKGLIYDDGRTVVSIGSSFSTPTADDLAVFNADGRQLVRVRNQAMHLMPFVGYLHRPNDRFFAQSFVQLDVDVNGDTVLVNPDGSGFRRAGRLNDPTFLYVDSGIGYWIYNNPDRCGKIQRIAPTMEVHHNTSLSNNDVIRFEGFRIGDFGQRIQRTNLLLGTTVRTRNNIDVSVAYVVPVGYGSDQQFDGELRVLMNQRF